MAERDPRGESPAARGGGPAWKTVAAFSWRLSFVPNIGRLLGAERMMWRPGDAVAPRVDGVVGWGEKANTRAAKAYARKHGLPYWRAEDGFLRSVGLGVNGDPPLSIVLDDKSIYYDAHRVSRLEAMLQRGDPGDPLADDALVARARRAIAQITANRLSKYNDSPPGPVDLGPNPGTGRVLVVDQTRNDLSVTRGLADADSFRTMLDAAVREHPNAEIIVKTHPDVVAGKKRGYLDRPLRGAAVRVFAEPVNPLALIEQVDHVYVVTSQLGFEALLMGKPVTCFGVPFYAGWGLTDDRCGVPRRSRARTVEQVFAAAYILYARYVDPDTGEPCEIERVIEHLALQRQQYERNRGTIYCFGFRVWKHNYVRAYLRSPGNRVIFANNARDAERRGFDGSARLLVWGQRETGEERGLAARHDVPIWRMEDGFLRSVGLGSDLATPASLVVDQTGIYYDPSRPSDLELILQHDDFTDEEVARARKLRREIVESGLSKYNVGESVRLPVPPGRRVVLAPGQVEDDASIRLGCGDVATNMGLLEEARAANPDAFIIYKPHPDVLSGNRAGRIDFSRALELCDHIETEASLAQCLAVADEVQTLTSLVGFEALLRGLRVVVYGQPFYSGWGLTVDENPLARRTRRRSLDELVAGTLIRYPRYLNRDTGRFTTPEVVISQLREERDSSSNARTVKISWPRRQLRKLAHIVRGMTHAP